MFQKAKAQLRDLDEDFFLLYSDQCLLTFLGPEEFLCKARDNWANLSGKGWIKVIV